VTRFMQLSLLLTLTFLLVLSAVLLRYEPIPDPGVNLASTETVHRVVWDRWTQRLCVAFLDRYELACTADELKSAASSPGISNEVRPQGRTVASPSVVGIEEVKAHLATQVTPENVGYIEKITRTEQNLVVDGWAADAAARSPAVAVHVFVADHDAAVGIPNLPRPDVATGFNITSPNVFGFHILAPVGSASGGDIHVFAQLHDGSFRELVMLHSLN
jgi:hypothetical protein